MEDLPKPLAKSLLILVIASTLLTAGAFLYVNDTLDTFDTEPREDHQRPSYDEGSPEPASSGGKVAITIARGANNGDFQ
ncbi:MAG: hypothetical protein ACQESG_04800 [Nanobdellota archaeon]